MPALLLAMFSLAGCVPEGPSLSEPLPVGKLAGGTGPAAQTTEAVMAPGSAPMTILALGDSYTIGESVSEEERWPVQLAAALQAQGLPVAGPVIVARTGWTTDELLAGIEQAGLSGTFDLVTLLIGVNNQYRGREIEEYRAGFRALLEQAQGFAGGRPEQVLVLSIPDWGVTPFAAGRDRAEIARQIDLFNRVNRQESEAAGIPYLDITPVSRQAANDPGLLAPDGLHPSGLMYAEWARLALPAALQALQGH